jgi:hypothetical protein
MDNVWDAVITKIYYKRKAGGESFDGLACWHKMKDILLKFPQTEYQWRDREDAEELDPIMGLVEKDDTGATILENHCLRQCVRIPRELPCNIMRVFHIAFNIGQFTALKEMNYVTLYKYELAELDDFIEADVIILLNQIIISNPIIVDKLLSL